MSHRAAGIALALLAAVSSCGPQKPRMREMYSDTFAFLVSADMLPPHARERTTYKVVVRDRESRQPIEGGEGRIFATSRDNANTWDSFTPGPEPGSYYANLNYVHSGEWAVAVQFRRDSVSRLERIDWMQEVRAARETGQF